MIKDIDMLAILARNFMDAQLALDDFIDDHPCIDAYDDAESQEHDELKQDKWDSYDALNMMLNKLNK